MPLEQAFNAYLKSNNQWNNCISNLGCSVDGIEGDLQRQWAIASKKIRKAESGLKKLSRPTF